MTKWTQLIHLPSPQKCCSVTPTKNGKKVSSINLTIIRNQRSIQFFERRVAGDD